MNRLNKAKPANRRNEHVNANVSSLSYSILSILAIPIMLTSGPPWTYVQCDEVILDGEIMDTLSHFVFISLYYTCQQRLGAV